MTRFMLTGHRGHLLVNITWDDGKLYGDLEAVKMIEGLATFYADQPIGNTVVDGRIYDRICDTREGIDLSQFLRHITRHVFCVTFVLHTIHYMTPACDR